MASRLLPTDRRWAAPTRKSGMTVLGKVPKPINLPSQRLENNGLDPNLELVPKGRLTWGTKLTDTTKCMGFVFDSDSQESWKFQFTQPLKWEAIFWGRFKAINSWE